MIISTTIKLQLYNFMIQLSAQMLKEGISDNRQKIKR